MSLEAIFLLLGVIVIVVVVVAQPFAEHWRVKIQSGHELSVLEANRENVLNALQELDFDHKLGKVPEDEYTSQRGNLLIVGADVLRQLDELQRSQLVSSAEPIQAAGMESPYKQLADDDLEELIAKRRATHQQKAAGFCPKCGKPVILTDPFCPACGQAINAGKSLTRN
jgi:NADH pyrophosphatase NudC (nudix superfamily)